MTDSSLSSMKHPSRFSGVGHWLAWVAFALVLIVAPRLFNTSAALSMLCLVAITTVFCLSYNILFGQTGLLSFGHAVYSGMGAFAAVHAMNLASDGAVWLPLPLVPLVGGLVGLAIGLVFGYVTTRRAGTTFAMITLGIAELAYACSHIFPRFFGGEAGITADRVYGTPFLGWTFGPQIQVYYLIACWLFVCTLAMYALTQTPLGRIANAVRDNPERAEFVGYDTQRVRYMMLSISAFFAGVSGGLASINFEVAGTEALSIVRSGDALFFTFIGGAGAFFGPILGAVAGISLTTKLPDLSAAWPLYLGLIFVFMVMFAPAGIAGLLRGDSLSLLRRAGRRLVPALLSAGVALVCLVVGAVLVVEMAYGHAFGDDKSALKGMVGTWTSSPVLVGVGLGVVLLVLGVLALRWARGAMAEIAAEDAANGETA